MILLIDSNGKKWEFQGGSAALRRIRDLTEVDLGLLHEEGQIAAFNDLVEDRDKSLAVIQAACGSEALQVDADAWDTAWDASAVMTAMCAIARECARFFTPTRSRVVISMLDRLERAYNEALSGAESRISNLALPSIELPTSAESLGLTAVTSPTVS